MKHLISLLALLISLPAFAIESGGTTIRCDDPSNDLDGVYVNYGNSWMNDGTSTTTFNVSAYGNFGNRFTVVTLEPSDSRDFPAGVTVKVTLDGQEKSPANQVELSYKAGDETFTLSVRPQDIHRDSYEDLGDDANYRATYSFPATFTFTKEGYGFGKPTKKLKCRASTGMHGMA